MYYMTDILEKKGQKLFNVIPLRNNIVPKHIMIDTSSLISYFDFLIPDDQIKTKYLTKVNNHKDEMWDQILFKNKSVFKSKDYTFYHQIQTDGISCSLLFIRKDLVGKTIRSSKNEPNDFPKIDEFEDKGQNIVGCDPGKRSLVCMIDDKGNKLQFTAPQRRFESKSKRSAYIMNKAKKGTIIEEIEADFSDSGSNSGTVNYEHFKRYI